ncbi:MAG: nuclease [Ignavibacteria bacterium]|nr:nuclease [Ignavibacteria bacterium]
MKEQKKSTPPIRIIVDDRESGSGVAHALMEMNGLEVEVRRLGLGDYCIDGNLLIERKTFGDLARSIRDGRLFQQGCRLASSPIRAAVILEGTADDLIRSHMRREAIQGALITLTIVLGIPVLRSRNPSESAHLMLYAARQMGRISFRSLPRRGKRPRGKRKLQLHILQGLPGVGPGRAERLIETFKSVEAVVTATPDLLAEVQGIGIKTAQAIRNSVTP